MFTKDQVDDLFEKANEIAFKKFKTGSYQEAEIILTQTLKVFPSELKTLQLMGLVKHNLRKFSEAIELFDKSIEIDPNNSENYNNLALCYSNNGEYKKAINLIEKAIELNPNCDYMHSNLGLQYRNINDLDNAIKCFQNSIKIEDNNELAWGMLGGCYGEMRNLEEAEKCFKRSIEINPNFANGHVDLANVYHLKGEWDKAWIEYEWRHEVFEQLKVWKNLYDSNKKWKGESLENKTIIVHGEQGHGDTIQFFRYVKYLKAAKIILHCSENLSSIFSGYVDEICIDEPNEMKTEQLPLHDYHCSILSLPYHLKLKEVPPFSLVVKKNVNLDTHPNLLNIGIVWAGNPQHPNDANRSCYLKHFNEIHDIPGVKLFSLVKDTRPRIYRFNPNQVDLTEDTDNMKIVDMSPMMNTFEDTASIINSLDLIITVDTSILHLAGSMNKTTLALLPWLCDWRWSSEDTTVWYPSVRLFRQPSKGDWQSVFTNVKKEIMNIVSEI